MKSAELKLTKQSARKVLAVVDAGLTSGLGSAEAGKTCVMGAISLALGLPHTDEPASCVGSAVRAFDIPLNDAEWSSAMARAKGMRREAIAKLGSNQIDQIEFAKELAIGTCRRIVPIALRAAASMIPARALALETAAVVC